MAKKHGIKLKKQFGQHFLQDERFLQVMIDAVELDAQSSVFEIGCGDGFLTAEILRQPIARLRIYEIDQEWANVVSNKFKSDNRLEMLNENFLDADLNTLKEHAPWTVLANLPYQITFPILHRFQQYRHYLKEGVIMIQEEVAQKIVKRSGRGYGFPSLFFQHYFEWKLLEKVPPSAFYPPPKVFSRLLYFKPIKNPQRIENEEGFWEFIKQCFAQPRRTLNNNLRGSGYTIEQISPDLLKLRAQQLDMQQLLEVWDTINR